MSVHVCLYVKIIPINLKDKVSSTADCAFKCLKLILHTVMFLCKYTSRIIY